MPRLLLYCKDLQLLTGKSESGVRRLITKINAHFNRRRASHLTIYDFCEFFTMQPEAVIERLK
jgi:hypothetical protein